MRTTEDREDNVMSFSQQNKLHRRMMIHKSIKVSFIILVLAAAVFILWKYVLHKQTSYTSYKVVSTYEMERDGDEEYYPFLNGVIRKMDEGFAYIENGKEKWNCGIAVDDAIVAFSDSYIATAEYYSSSVCLIDEGGSQYSITTSYPVVDLTVSNQGIVAVVLDDGEANYIELRDKANQQIAMGRTVIQGDGYPVSVSISEDGTKLAVSYLSVTNGSSQSSVVFYNYSSVGQEEVDRIVGGFNHYKSSVVPRVAFVGNNTVAAFGSELFTIYSIKQIPSIQKEMELEQQVESVFYNDSYIGIVQTGQNTKHTVLVYDKSGNNILKYNTDYDYTGVTFAGKNVLLYNSKSCLMVNRDGEICFEYEFDETITRIVPTSSDSYVVVFNNKIQEITLQ